MSNYKEHAKRLLTMLELKNPCSCCPYYREAKVLVECVVCLSFVNIHIYGTCPCYKLGSFEALKRTYLKLEELGYI